MVSSPEPQWTSGPYNHLNEVCRKQRQEIVRVLNEKNALESQYTNAIIEMEGNMMVIKKELLSLTQRVEEHNVEKARRESEMKSLKQQQSSLAQENTALRDQLQQTTCELNRHHQLAQSQCSLHGCDLSPMREQINISMYTSTTTSVADPTIDASLSSRYRNEFEQNEQQSTSTSYLHRCVSELLSENDTLLSKFKDIQKDVTHYQEKIATLEDECSNYERRINDLQCQLSDAEREIRQFSKSKISQTVEGLVKKVKLLEEELRSVEHRNTEHHRDVTVKLELSEAQCVNAAQEITDLRMEAIAVAKRALTLEESKAKLQREVQALTDREQELREAKIAAQSMLDTLQKRFAELEVDLFVCRKEKENLQKDSDYLAESLTKSECEKSDFLNKLNQIEQVRGEWEDEREVLKKEIQSLKESVSHQKSELSQCARDRASLSTSVRQLDIDKQELKREVEDAKARLQELEQVKGEFAEQRSVLTSALHNLEMEKVEWGNKLLQAIQSRQQLELTIEDLRNNNQSLKVSLSSCEQRLIYANSAREALERKVDELSQSNSKLKRNAESSQIQMGFEFNENARQASNITSTHIITTEMLSLANLDKLQKLQQEIRRTTDEFGNLSRKFEPTSPAAVQSIDINELLRSGTLKDPYLRAENKYNGFTPEEARSVRTALDLLEAYGFHADGANLDAVFRKCSHLLEEPIDRLSTQLSHCASELNSMKEQEAATADTVVRAVEEAEGHVATNNRILHETRLLLEESQRARVALQERLERMVGEKKIETSALETRLEYAEKRVRELIEERNMQIVSRNGEFGDLSIDTRSPISNAASLDILREKDIEIDILKQKLIAALNEAKREHQARRASPAPTPRGHVLFSQKRPSTTPKKDGKVANRAHSSSLPPSRQESRKQHITSFSDDEFASQTNYVTTDDLERAISGFPKNRH